MPTNQEIEAKFRVRDPEQLEHLQSAHSLGSRFPLLPTPTVVNVDTYFDTPDLRLLRLGRTLRIRTQDDQVFLTLKSIELNSPRGVHSRLEVERPAPNLTPDAETVHIGQLPPEIAEALSQRFDDSTVFKRLVRLHQIRDKRDVLHKDSGARQWMGDDSAPVLGELSLDRITVYRPTIEREALWAQAGRFDAIELEAASDESEIGLRPLVSELAKLPGVAPDAHNKLHQALAVIYRGNDEGEGGEDLHRQHMAELCRRVWREQLVEMVVNEAGVRDSDDIEYVHDMRVATRRARSAARLYAGFFDPHSRRVRRFVRRLRTTGRRLGKVRDLDVALENLQKFCAEREMTWREGLFDLSAHWQQKRDRAHVHLLGWLNSAAYRAFVRNLMDFCTTPGRDAPVSNPVAGRAPIPWQVRHVLPSMILTRYEAIRAFEPLFEEGGAPPVETLHALRIECKYLRYHLEFNAGLLGEEGEALIAQLKALQEHLGQLNDASVSEAMLTSAHAKVGGDAILAYRAIQAEAVQRLRTDVPADLTRFLSEETRRSLALALARI